MINRTTDEANAMPESLGELIPAPPDTLERFRKRASFLQGTRFVLERQMYAFWILLNTFLRLLFKRADVPVPPADQALSRRYRQATQITKDGRQ